jgi:hypothetical protein
VIGDDETKDRITEELEALVRFVDWILRAEAAVCQGKGKQRWVIESMPQTLTERV